MGVEEVVSDAFEEGLSIGYRFKNINDSFWVSGCGGCPSPLTRAGRRARPAKHLVGCPRGACQGRGAPRRSSQGLIFTDQVLLLAVGISAGERNIVKVFPEKVIKLKVALSCFLFIGIDLEGRQILGKQPPISFLFLLVKFVGE